MTTTFTPEYPSRLSGPELLDMLLDMLREQVIRLRRIHAYKLRLIAGIDARALATRRGRPPPGYPLPGHIDSRRTPRRNSLHTTRC